MSDFIKEWVRICNHTEGLRDYIVKQNDPDMETVIKILNRQVYILKRIDIQKYENIKFDPKKISTLFEACKHGDISLADGDEDLERLIKNYKALYDEVTED